MQKRKVREGVVTSNKMDKTIVVSVERKFRHPRYGKVVKSKKKYYVDADNNAFNIGDQVKITETKPLSKLKRWRVVKEIVEKRV